MSWYAIHTNRMTKLIQAKRVNGPDYVATAEDMACRELSQRCNVKAPFMLLLHSQYDIGYEDLCAIFDAHEPVHVTSVIHFGVEVLLLETGVITDCKTVFSKFLDMNGKRKINFSFQQCSALSYTHDPSQIENIKKTNFSSI